MNLKNSLKLCISDLFDLFYPKLCFGCNGVLRDHEDTICYSCLYELSVTQMHKDVFNNPVTELFSCRADIVSGCSFFDYIKGGLLQRLIHDLKYNDVPQVGVVLGKYAGRHLLEQKAFDDVDFLVPVPLHRIKFLKRGYNQAERIAFGLSYYLKIPVNEQVLLKVNYNQTQTKKKKLDRWINALNIYQAQPQLEQFHNKHFLLVDDVLTTGSTLESCIIELKKIPGSKVSVFTLGKAK